MGNRNRFGVVLLLLFFTLTGWAQNIRVTSLTATTAITNNGQFVTPAGAGNLKIWTSDANGIGSWQAPGSAVDTNAMARLNGLGTNGTWNGHTVSAGGVTNKVPVTNASYVTTGGPVTNKGETYLEGNVSVVSPAVLSGRISASTVTNSGTLQQNGSAHFTGRIRMVDSTITISGGVALPSRVRHLIDTEAAAASDDLDTLSVIGDDDGFTLILSPADDAHTVVIKHNTGNILCAGGVDITLDDLQDLAILYFQSGVGWYAAPIARDVTQGSVTLEGPVTVQGNFQVTPGSGTVLIDVPLEAGNTLNVILETTLNDVHVREDLYLDGPLIRVPLKTTSGVLDVAGLSQGSSWTFNTSTNFSFSFSGAASNGQLATLTVNNSNATARIFGTNAAGVVDVFAKSNRTVWEFESNGVTQVEFWFTTNFVAAGQWFLVDWKGPEWTVKWSTNITTYTNGVTREVEVTAAAGGGSGDITGGNANQFTEAAGVLTIADGSLQTNNVLRGALTTLGATATTNAGYLTVGGPQTNKSAVRIDATLRITGSGALTMDDILSATVLGTDGSGLVIPRTASAVLDVIGSTRGSILYRGAAGWTILAPGTAGQVLHANGAGTDPTWDTDDNSGSATLFNDIGDAGGDGVVALGTSQHLWTSALNGGIGLSLSNSVADLTTDTALLDLVFRDNADANGILLRARHNAGATTALEVRSTAMTQRGTFQFGTDTLNWDGTTLTVSNGPVVIYTSLQVVGSSDLSAGATTLAAVLGVIDAGGATSFELPNGNDPDLTVEGQLSYDNNGDVLRAFDGANQVAIARKIEAIHCTVTLPNDLADSERDAFWVWSNESGMSFVVTGWKAWSDTDDTTLNIEEIDADGQNNATVDAVEIATNGTGLFSGSDTTITGATIENGHLLVLDFDDTDTPGQVKITIFGFYDANVN